MKYLAVFILLLSFLFAQNIPNDYFGMHFQGSGTLPTLLFGKIRFWDTHTGWADIETSAGHYDFSGLDKHIAAAKAKGVPMIWTLGRTPTFYSTNPTDTTCHRGPGYCWPPKDLASGNGHFKAFMAAMLKHTGTSITYWEGWNEPNGKGFWSGTVVQLVQMQKDYYAAVHAKGLVVLMPPSFSSYIPSMLTAGMGQYADINTFHGKSCAPESVISTVNTIKGQYAAKGFGNRPLWNSEGGWGRTANCSSSQLQVDAVARLYLLHWWLGVSEYLWYAYDNNAWGQLGIGNTLNPAGVAYRELEGWMIGNAESCSHNGSVWACTFSNQTQAVWASSGTSSYQVPAGYGHVRDLSAHISSIGSSIQATGSPVLLTR